MILCTSASMILLRVVFSSVVVYHRFSSSFVKTLAFAVWCSFGKTRFMDPYPWAWVTLWPKFVSLVIKFHYVCNQLCPWITSRLVCRNNRLQGWMEDDRICAPTWVPLKPQNAYTWNQFSALEKLLMARKLRRRIAHNSSFTPELANAHTALVFFSLCFLSHIQQLEVTCWSLITINSSC